MATRSPDDHGGMVLAERAQHVAALLKLLANEQRLLLLCRLRYEESSVGALVDLCGLSPSGVSQHLARLRRAGIVTTRREQTSIYYSLANAETAQLIEYLCGLFGAREGHSA